MSGQRTLPARPNGHGQAPAKAKPPTLAIKDLMERKKDYIVRALPKHMDAGRVIETVAALISQDGNLMRCSPDSILRGVVEGSSLGLSFSKAGGEAYLVPFGGEAQFMPGYRGFIKLAYQSGHLALIKPMLVYENEHFIYRRSTAGTQFEHEPNVFGQRGPVIGAYTYYKLTNGEADVDVLNRAEIEKRRNVSKMKNSGAWKDWEEEMILKTSVRHAQKSWPRCAELDRAVEAFDRFHDLGRTQVHTAEAGPRGVAGLEQRLGLAAPEPDYPPEPEYPSQASEDGLDYPEPEREREPGEDG